MARDKEYEVLATISPDLRTFEIQAWEALAPIFRNFIDKDLLIKVSPHRKNRSNRQNRYIWGVVVPTVQSWFKQTEGIEHEREEIYVWLRTSLIGDTLEMKEVDGMHVPVMSGKRFSAMNTKEFAEAIDTIINKMDERECYIPLPKGENTLTEFAMRDE